MCILRNEQSMLEGGFVLFHLQMTLVLHLLQLHVHPGQCIACPLVPFLHISADSSLCANVECNTGVPPQLQISTPVLHSLAKMGLELHPAKTWQDRMGC
jgi:hypothetical protein